MYFIHQCCCRILAPYVERVPPQFQFSSCESSECVVLHVGKGVDAWFLCTDPDHWGLWDNSYLSIFFQKYFTITICSSLSNIQLTTLHLMDENVIHVSLLLTQLLSMVAWSGHCQSLRWEKTTKTSLLCLNWVV